MKVRFKAGTSRWMVWLTLALAPALIPAEAREIDEARYRVFVDRNPFGLRPPATNVVQPPPPAAPPVQANVSLSGISEFRGVKKAWLVVPAVPGKTTNTLHLSLQEGERDGDIEVVEIDVPNESVKILNAGTAVTLDFEENGLALNRPPPGAAAAKGRTTAARRAGVPLPRPNSAAPRTSTVGQSRAAVGPGNRTLPSAVPTAATSGRNTRTAVRTIPARNVRTSNTRSSTPTVDRATQIIMMRAQEAAAQAEGRITPPLPPLPGLN